VLRDPSPSGTATKPKKPAKPKTPKKPPPFFKDALETLAQEEKRIIKFVRSEMVPESVPLVRKFVEVAKAIDREDKKAVPGLLDDFLSSDMDPLPFGFPSDQLAKETYSRLLRLGLSKESERIRSWYLQQSTRWDATSKTLKDYTAESWLWSETVESLLPPTIPAGAAKSFDALCILFNRMRNELVGLDLEAVKKDAKRRSVSGEVLGLRFRENTISVYYATLIELLQQSFAALQVAYQVLLEKAVDDLGAGKKGDDLADLDLRLAALIGLVDPKDEKKKVGGLEVEATRSDFTEKNERHLDYFIKGKAGKARAIGIESYDVEIFSAAEVKMDFARVLATRREQLAFLKRLYGMEKDAKGGLTLEAAEHKAILDKQKLRLHSNDDWRRFLFKKFEQLKAREGKAGALTAVVKLLESYLRVFTTHTPYNIEEFGDNYLSREFPRAMTGQLIHDCGVYALRIAYMLSLLRDHPDLRLRFRFMALPVHVALIITGDGLPLYFSHNDSIWVIGPSELADIRARWARLDEKGDPREPGKGAAKGEEDQFIAEVVGHHFIPDTSLPFRLLEAAKTGGDEGKAKKALWNFYTKVVAPAELFGPTTRDPKSPHFQFHLRYLNVLDKLKEHHNKHLVPFWNGIGHPAWLTHGPGMVKALKELTTATTADQKDQATRRFAKSFEGYRKIIEPAFGRVEAEFSPIVPLQVELGNELKEHPEILDKGAGQTHGERIAQLTQAWWRELVQEHLIDLGLRRPSEAPYARREDLLWPLD
jgi:hypothetical protein